MSSEAEPVTPQRAKGRDFGDGRGKPPSWVSGDATRSRSEGEAPTKLQVRDLIDGSRWLLTNIF